MVAILMMSDKMATLGFPKIKEFWNKGYAVIIFSDVTNHQPNFVTWRKLYCTCGHVTKVW